MDISEKMSLQDGVLRTPVASPGLIVSTQLRQGSDVETVRTGSLRIALTITKRLFPQG